MKLDLATVVGLLLTAGGAAFLTSLVRSWGDLRRGARAGQREVVADLIDWRDDLDRQRQLAQRDADFWRDLAGERGGQLRDRQIVPANPYPVPPSHREAPASPRHREARARRAAELEGDEA